MATNKRRSHGGNRSRGGLNNNPEGRNQYTGIMNTARHNPLAAAVAVGGAVATGVFLWSRRNQISDQIDHLADQISEWRDGTRSNDDLASENAASVETSGDGGADSSERRTQAEISEEALTLKEIGKTV